MARPKKVVEEVKEAPKVEKTEEVSRFPFEGRVSGQNVTIVLENDREYIDINGVGYLKDSVKS